MKLCTKTVSRKSEARMFCLFLLFTVARSLWTPKMTQYLPPNLLALFAPRDPIPYIAPIEKHKNHRKLPYTGIAQFLGEFEVSNQENERVSFQTLT